MTEIEKKALALLNEVERAQGDSDLTRRIIRELPLDEALCRAIERHEADKAAHAATIEGILNSHEAYRQGVSDAVEAYNDLWRNRTPGRDEFMGHFRRFVLPKPDPLVEDFGHDLAADIRAAIEKRGGRVVWGEG